MERINIEHYLVAIIPFKKLLKDGIISNDEFNIAEDYLAKKYCIKKGSLYRSNDLINSAFRVINSVPKKEV